MKSIDFVVSSDPTTAKQTFVQLLADQEFRVTWNNEWEGFAERGSQTKAVFAGAFSMYYKFGLRVMSGEPGQTVIQLLKITSGLQGGAIGVQKTRKLITKLRADFTAALTATGTLVEVRED